MIEQASQDHQRLEGLVLPEGVRVNPVAQLDDILVRYETEHLVLPTARRDLRSLQLSMKREYAWRRGMHVVTNEEEVENVFPPGSGRFPLPLNLVLEFRVGDNKIDDFLHDVGVENGMEGILEVEEEAMKKENNPEKYLRVRGVKTALTGVSLNFLKDDKTGMRNIGARFEQPAVITSILSPVLPQLSNWFRDRETYIEEWLFTYYNAIDGGDLEAALAIFADDKKGKATYKRGEEEFVGMKRIREFYEGKRTLFIGKHYFEPFQISEDEAHVEGVFGGIELNRRHTQFRFTDHFVFAGDRVIRRESSFPDGGQH